MSLEMRQGTVTQVFPVLKVAVAPATLGSECRAAAAYTSRAIGDQVTVLVQSSSGDRGGDRFVVGKNS